MMMLISEINGLTVSQKERLAADFEPRFKDGPPFEDDKPTHAVSLERLSEKQAAMSGVLACDHIRPELLLLARAGPVLLELQAKHDRSPIVLSTNRQPDEVVLASMYWAANYAGSLGSLSLSGIAERDGDAARLAAFIGGEDEFTSSLAVAQGLVANMEEVGLFAEINPDHVDNLPWPGPGRPNFFPESLRRLQ